MVEELHICEKQRYVDQKEAEDMIEFLVSDGRAEPNELDCYKCHVCNFFHLTNKRTRQWKSR